MTPEAYPQALARFVQHVAIAEDRAIAAAAAAGNAMQPPCGVRVRRSLSGPVEIGPDPAVPAGEVHVCQGRP
jgi:methylglyoxal synthase